MRIRLKDASCLELPWSLYERCARTVWWWGSPSRCLQACRLHSSKHQLWMCYLPRSCRAISGRCGLHVALPPALINGKTSKLGFPKHDRLGHSITGPLTPSRWNWWEGNWRCSRYKARGLPTITWCSKDMHIIARREIFLLCICVSCRSQWSRGLRHEPSSPARTLGIVGSNPTGGTDVCMPLFCVYVVLFVYSGLATGWSPVQGVIPTVLN
jgi:hypothetical protein